MELNLKRPIVFFDLETTGVDPAKDRIVEISMVKIMPDGSEDVRTRLINPQMHIPETSTAIHGITDDDVRDAPTFAQIAKSLYKFIEGCDFGGFNSNRFDLPMLVEEFLRHLSMTSLAVLLALVIGVPLGIFITRHKKLSAVVIAVANVMQSIPCMALLARGIPVGGIGEKLAEIVRASCRERLSSPV